MTTRGNYTFHSPWTSYNLSSSLSYDAATIRVEGTADIKKVLFQYTCHFSLQINQLLSSPPFKKNRYMKKDSFLRNFQGHWSCFWLHKFILFKWQITSSRKFLLPKSRWDTLADKDLYCKMLHSNIVTCFQLPTEKEKQERDKHILCWLSY